MAEIIKDIVRFLEVIKTEKIVSIKFIKKDGSERIMKCTLDFGIIPKAQHPKEINLLKILKTMQNTGILHVFDVEKKEWRSVPFQSVEWLVTPEKKMYQILPEKKK
jgi:hypothetical protein